MRRGQEEQKATLIVLFTSRGARIRSCICIENRSGSLNRSLFRSLSISAARAANPPRVRPFPPGSRFEKKNPRSSINPVADASLPRAVHRPAYTFSPSSSSRLLVHLLSPSRAYSLCIVLGARTRPVLSTYNSICIVRQSPIVARSRRRAAY